MVPVADVVAGADVVGGAVLEANVVEAFIKLAVKDYNFVQYTHKL